MDVGVISVGCFVCIPRLVPIINPNKINYILGIVICYLLRVIMASCNRNASLTLMNHHFTIETVDT